MPKRPVVRNANEWSFVNRSVCKRCTAVRKSALEAKRRIGQKHCGSTAASSALSTSCYSLTKVLSLEYPEEPTCCIHALEEHIIDWIRSMDQISDHLIPQEVVNCANLAIKQLDGEPFVGDEWLSDFLDRNPDLVRCLLIDKPPSSSSLYHAALGHHETTFKSILALVASLGIHMRKADLTTLALNCKNVLQWQTAFPLTSPGLSWCRRFVTRYPEISRFLYLQNRIASYAQVDGVQLIHELKPFIKNGRTSLNDVERIYIYSKMPSLTNATVPDDDEVLEHEAQSGEVAANDLSRGSTNVVDLERSQGLSQYSSPNKFIRNAIIEDVLNIMCAQGVSCKRDDMRLVVKTIADTFGWKTVYDNNLPSKSWTLRFMVERPSIREYVDQSQNGSGTRLNSEEFENVVISALEQSEQAKIHHPEFYAPADDEAVTTTD